MTDTIVITIRWYRKGTNLTLTQKCRREQFKKNVEICIQYRPDPTQDEALPFIELNVN